jgi:MarR family transcriptional regulator, organic hydroperoxide resistance regulator
MAKSDEGEDGRGPAEFPWSESVAFQLRDAYRSFARALQDALEAHDVNAGSWLFLRHLWEEDGITQRELTERVGLMQPNTNAALKQLARRGLIRQTVDSEDRRKLNIYLTRKGKALRHKLIPLAVGIRNDAVRGISAGELESVERVLSKMKANLRERIGDRTSASEPHPLNGVHQRRKSGLATRRKAPGPAPGSSP